MTDWKAQAQELLAMLNIHGHRKLESAIALALERAAAVQREKDAKIADSMDGRLWYEIAAAIRSAP